MKYAIFCTAIIFLSMNTNADTAYDPVRDDSLPSGSIAQVYDAEWLGLEASATRMDASASRALAGWEVPNRYGRAADAWRRQADRDNLEYGRYLASVDRWREHRQLRRRHPHERPDRHR